jgi:hypothetical protein
VIYPEDGSAYPPLGGPFGDIGTELARDTTELIGQLSAPLDTSGPQQPEKPDCEALITLSNIEFLRPLLLAEHESVIGDGQSRLDQLWTTFHTALPFSEAERVWIMRTCSEHSEIHSQEVLDVIGRQEGEIVASGLRQRVSGRDLMHRWLSWRRETDEYADQGTLDIAREALLGLATLLNPRQHKYPG